MMAGHRLPPERVGEVLDCLAAGMNPMRAARAAGVSKSFICVLHRKMGGVSYCDRYLARPLTIDQADALVAQLRSG